MVRRDALAVPGARVEPLADRRPAAMFGEVVPRSRSFVRRERDVPAVTAHLDIRKKPLTRAAAQVAHRLLERRQVEAARVSRLVVLGRPTSRVAARHRHGRSPLTASAPPGRAAGDGRAPVSGSSQWKALNARRRRPACSAHARGRRLRCSPGDVSPGDRREVRPGSTAVTLDPALDESASPDPCPALPRAGVGRVTQHRRATPADRRVARGRRAATPSNVARSCCRSGG